MRRVCLGRHLLSSLCLFVFPLALISQINFVSVSLKDPDKNILYAGVENHVRIEGIKYDTSYTMTSSSGMANRNGDPRKSHYVLYNKKLVNDTLKLYKDGELVHKEIFKVETLPRPIARLGHIESNSASREEILKDPVIHVIMPDCEWNQVFTFEGFDLILLSEDGHIVYSEKKIEGTKLSKSHLEKIEELNSGDAVIIKNIIARCEGTAGMVMSPISITVL